jgi:membrane protease YdiL (CAAX protease family)
MDFEPRKPHAARLALLLFVVALAWPLIAMLIALGAALRVVAQGLTFEGALDRVMAEPLGPSLAQLAALGIVILVGVRTAYGDASLREVLQIRPARPPVLLLAIVAGLSLQFPLVELTAIVSDMVPAIALSEDQIARLERMMRIDGPVRAITVPLAIVVVPAVSEELLFRGLLLRALAARQSRVRALLLTSLLFGVFHLEPIALPYSFVAGLVLGAVALRTGSVLPSIALHAAFNAAPLLFSDAIVHIEGFNAEHESHLSPALVAATVVLSATALALLFRLGAPSAASGSEDEDPPSDDETP